MLSQHLRKFCLLEPTGCRGLASEALAIGINLKKGGSDPPLRPSEEYPEWVQVLATTDQTLYELRRRAAADREDSLSDREAMRMTKLESRASIKSKNAMKAKK